MVDWYTLAFQATGCPNPRPVDNTLGTDDATLIDMMAYCVVTRDNTADERQRKHCCGSNDCTIEKCTKQKKLSDGMYYNI